MFGNCDLEWVLGWRCIASEIRKFGKIGPPCRRAARQQAILAIFRHRDEVGPREFANTVRCGRGGHRKLTRDAADDHWTVPINQLEYLKSRFIRDGAGDQMHLRKAQCLLQSRHSGLRWDVRRTDGHHPRWCPSERVSKPSLRRGRFRTTSLRGRCSHRGRRKCPAD